MTLSLALYEPEIPANTGNLIRLCANALIPLHLIKPLGFTLDDKRLRRAGLDYHEWASLIIHDNFPAFLNTIDPNHLYAASTKGTTLYHNHSFTEKDVLLFGPETRGLPKTILETLKKEQILRLPMQENSRSLNLANAASIMIYEGLRQLGFPQLS
jgi:tRNA (cytidine/uridine-2'-O-)-methyltransferase